MEGTHSLHTYRIAVSLLSARATEQELSNKTANLLNALCGYAVLAAILLAMMFAEPVLRAIAPAVIALAVLSDAFTFYLAIRRNYVRHGPSGIPLFPWLAYCLF